MKTFFKAGRTIYPYLLIVVGVFCLVIWARPARAAISFVQSASSTAEYFSGSYTSSSVQFNSSVTTGDMVAVIIQYDTNEHFYRGLTSDDLVTGCRDTNNPTSSYREAIDSANGDYNGVDIWYATNVTGGSNPTVTCTFSQLTDTVSMGIAEYSGVATSSALDNATFVNDSASSTSWSSGDATTQSSGDLVIGGFEAAYNTLGYTAGSGFTKRIDQGMSTGLMMEDGIQASAGAIAATASSSVPFQGQEALLAAFRPATAPLPSGIRWIQNANNFVAAGVNPNAQFINPVTTGDTIVVGMALGDADTGIIGCRDTYNPTSSFQLAVQTSSWPSWGTVDLWYATNVTGGANDVVTCSTNDSIANKLITLSEYAGVASLNALDATSTNYSASSSVFTTGTSTTHYSGDLVVGMMTHLTDDNTAILSAGSGYTIRETNTGTGMEDEIQSLAGAVAANAINTETDSNEGVLAAFKAGNASSPPTINSFLATPTEILVGSSTVLSWNVANASSVAITATGFSFSTSTLVASTTATPTTTTMYTLTATNSVGTSTATTTVPIFSLIGTLDSQTYDTGDTNGAQLDSVEWKGSLGVTGTSVQFQFAVGNTPTGTWTSSFTGPDGTASTYYVPSGPGVQTPLSYSLYSGFRYFRYRVTLLATATSSPVVNDIIIDWSP